MTLLQPTERGLYCAVGDFYIDPWKPVRRAVVTHAHGDHLAWGHENYLVATPGRRLAEARLGNVQVETASYGEQRFMNGVTVSFHPAGHILGSAQVRVEHRGEIWVVSGDYKTDPDVTCAPFDPQQAHVFVTESTFGLPVYRWPATATVRADLLAWVSANRAAGLASVVFGYALGKAQRLLSMLTGFDGPIWTHGAVEQMTRIYRESGISLPQTTPVADAAPDTNWSTGVVVAPPSAAGTPWIRRFGAYHSAFASGWMLVRGARRRRGVDRGFPLSDHVDWPSMMSAIAATGASRIYATHGFTDVVARYLRELGYDAGVIPTRWEGERDDGSEPDVEPAP